MRSELEKSHHRWGRPREVLRAATYWAEGEAAKLFRFFAVAVPTFWAAFVPCLLVSAALYTRSVLSNFIFDEQEALLANPYVNGQHLGFWEAVHRDFWGLPADRSVGSYRPIPDLLWRILASILKAGHDLGARIVKTSGTFTFSPWVFHWLNVVIHAANGAILVAFIYRVTGRRSVAWLSGASFVMAAVLTEAVTGVVGAADVLGGMGALLALSALALPLRWMPLAVLAATLFGLFSKESAIVCVALVPLAVLVLAPFLHPERPWRLARAALAFVASAVALVVYVELRKRWFDAPLPAELRAPPPEGAGPLQRAAHAALKWFHQPSLPRDPLNNPLVNADVPHRIAGALRVYFRGLVQVVFPYVLSGDYSFPQEPIPDKLVFPESVLGALGMVVPLLAAPILYGIALVREARLRRRGSPSVLALRGASCGLSLAALGLVWVVVSYFPHSNIPVLLPTVRAERFWYYPVIGSSMLLGLGLSRLIERSPRGRWKTGAAAFVVAFFSFQSLQARAHAFDYADDLVFWGATKDAVPRSAKAHLNYSVMWGARGHLETRLEENRIAVDLAPNWAMAQIYLGDTLCRMHRAEEAWPYYVRGFHLGENDLNLIALALQCLWDEKYLLDHKEALLATTEKHHGSWLEYLVKDTIENGEENGGVDPKYRPRGYNEGPKE